MAEIKQSLEVDVPISVAYDQWSRFESFPIFMDSVRQVEKMSEDEVFFHTQVQGVDRSWKARIIKNEPEREIEWRSEDEPKNRGRVLFVPLDEDRTKVTLIMEYEPEDWREKLGNVTGLVDRRVRGDLDRFKAFIERKQGTEGSGRGGRA